MRKSKFLKLFVRVVGICAIFVSVFLAASLSLGSMTDCIDATCRITATDGGRGSGCVFEIGAGRVYVLTAAHVVGKDRAVQCEFWREGHQSQPLAGEVVARSENTDTAIVAVAEGLFGGVLPSVVPIAPRDYVVAAGATLTSVGCANGTWSTGWKGHSLGYNGGDLHFLPTPANGRSGSAVFDAEGKMIVAVLRARTGNDSEGIATSVQCLYDTFSQQGNASNVQWRESAENNLLVQCPGGSCPGGTCPVPQQTPYLLPYRYREQFRNQQQTPQQPASPQQSPVWPTLPGVQSNSVDLGPTNQKLDKIADALGTLLKNQTAEPMPVVPAQPPVAPVDETARKAAEDAKTQAAAIKNEVEKIGAQTKSTSEKFGKIDEVLGKFGADPETLIQRAMDRVSKVKAELGANAEPDDVLKAYAKDLIKERIREGVGGLSFDKLVSVGGGIPAAGLAIFACVVVWKLVNNRPLAIENLAPNSLAGRTAAELREHVSAVVEPIKNKIEARLGQITGVATEAKAAAEAAKAVSQAVSAQSTTAGK